MALAKLRLLNVINGVIRPDSGRFVSTVRSSRGGDHPISPLPALPVRFKLLGCSIRSPRCKTSTSPFCITEPAERAAAGQRAEDLLAFVGLERLASLAASELSGGQQRLLEFARALVTKPSLVLMDEPFAGVHPEIKSRLVDCIRERSRAMAPRLSSLVTRCPIWWQCRM